MMTYKMMTYKILLICCTTATKTKFLIIAVVSKYILAKSIQCVSRPYFLAWSTEGCQTYPGKLPDTIRCECKHLTNFALLIDVNQSGSNPMSLYYYLDRMWSINFWSTTDCSNLHSI